MVHDSRENESFVFSDTIQFVHKAAEKEESQPKSWLSISHVPPIDQAY